MLTGLSQTVERQMSDPLVLVLPFIFAATRSLTLGIQSPSGLGSRPIIPVEKEHAFLRVVTFCLIGLLVGLGLMVRFPDLGALIEEDNQF
jgi:hypothetical protein